MINLNAFSSFTHTSTPSLLKKGWFVTAPARDYRTEIAAGHWLNVAHPSTTAPDYIQRIVIIGSSGSGKSTLARALGRQLNIHVIHLDKHFWGPGWVPTNDAVWSRCVEKMVQAPRWIIDGNYRRTLDIRLQTADTVIFLDMPRLTCIGRAIKRRVQYAFTTRPDIASGCDEQIFDPSLFAFLRRIWNYPYRARPDVLHRLHQLRTTQQLVWLRSPQEVNRFLAAVEKQPEPSKST